MKRTTRIPMGWRFRFAMVTAIVFLFAGMGEREGIRPDVLYLQGAGSLTGHFLALRDDVIIFFTLGGELRLPENRVDSVFSSSEGESELYLGTGFLERGVLDSAEEWLREAQKFPAWEDAAEKALTEMEIFRRRDEKERQEAKRKELGTLIFGGNYEQGLRAIERWSSGEEDQSIKGTLLSAELVNGKIEIVYHRMVPRGFGLGFEGNWYKDIYSASETVRGLEIVHESRVYGRRTPDRIIKGKIEWGPDGEFLPDKQPAFEEKDFNYPEYADRLMRTLSRNWDPPAWQTTRQEGIYTQICFMIQSNGTIVRAYVEQESGWQELDDSALRAVRKSSPVEPLPAGYRGSTVTAHAKFNPIPR
ncbi:MAG: TonB C-terminal domain-containing protein, partial [bacterium]